MSVCSGSRLETRGASELTTYAATASAAPVADGKHARVDGYVSLGVVASAGLVNRVAGFPAESNGSHHTGNPQGHVEPLAHRACPVRGSLSVAGWFSWGLAREAPRASKRRSHRQFQRPHFVMLPLT